MYTNALVRNSLSWNSKSKYIKKRLSCRASMTLRFSSLSYSCLLEAEIFRLLWEGWARARARAKDRARARARARAGLG